MNLLKGKIIGLFQNDEGYFARCQPDYKDAPEFLVPITTREWYELKTNSPIRIMVEIVT